MILRQLLIVACLAKNSKKGKKILNLSILHIAREFLYHFSYQSKYYKLSEWLQKESYSLNIRLKVRPHPAQSKWHTMEDDVKMKNKL